MDPLETLLAHDPAWHPPHEELDRWVAEARREGSPDALLREARWWEAHAAALRADWDSVTTLAAEGLAEPFSEREAFRLALLHALSGRVAEAQHVLAQAIQWSGDASLLRRFADACAAEGLAEAAALFRALLSGGAGPPR